MPLPLNLQTTQKQYLPLDLAINSKLNDIRIELHDIPGSRNPIWTVDQPVIRLDLGVRMKKDIHPTHFIQQFNT